MAFHYTDTHPLRRPSRVPYSSSTILLLLVCSFVLLCCSGSSSASSSDENYYEPYTLSSPFNQTDGFLFVANPNTIIRKVSGGLHGSHIRGNNSYHNHLSFNLSDSCWFFIRQPIYLWKHTYGDEGAVSFHEASFHIKFIMSVYQPRSSLVFAIHPSLDYDLGYPISSPAIIVGTSSNTSSSWSSSSPAGGIHVSAQTSTVYGTFLDFRNASLVQIDIDQSADNTSSTTVLNRSWSYSVWIDYDHVDHSISVSVATQGTPSTATAKGVLKLSSILPEFASLGFYSTLGQLLHLDEWSLTAERLPYSTSNPPLSTDSQAKRKGISNGGTIILCSVLGSTAAVAMTAAVVYVYFNSKYRRWKKKQDKLVKTMRRLPGVPTQVDYADIRKATKNFHDTMKLGKGGFGAVYRCTLPAASLRTTTVTGTTTMEVAVKKFMRDVEDRRYDDFLAEVSVINRLRHKNIVPLVGWSYNKGEPLLIYEYMTNGSLDQHLFRKRGRVSTRTSTRQQQQQEDDDDTASSLWQWHTRYSIARDIATGLHYVHHEHEPMVLHRDIKASNIMLDSAFRARLGDFGIACTVAVNRSSVTGIAGTFGYIGPDYAMRHKATRQTDVYAFGVLVLEIVTGKKNGDVVALEPDDDEDDHHITDWVWRHHREGKLLDAAHGVLAGEEEEGVVDEARRLLLLGLACTNPNPSDRPSMVEVLQVLTKSAPPPDVPLERPPFVWPPVDWRSRNSVYSTAVSGWDDNGSSATATATATASTVELGQIIIGQESGMEETTPSSSMSLPHVSAN